MTMLQHGLVPSTGGYRIERSLRFNSADSAYLNRTPASDTSSNKKGTFSCWMKVSSNSGTNGGTFLGAADNNHYGQFYNQSLYFGNSTAYLNTAAVFRDFSAWYHIVFVFDTTLATTNDRMIIYVNNVRQAVGGFNTQPTQNASFVFLNTTQQYDIGRRSSGDYFNGYMTEINFIDGSAKTPSDFGETDTDTGVWKPKAYSGSYGTNGFYLKFADNSGTTSTTLGKDSSGNGNNWTPNNFSVTAGAGNDSLVDTPTPYGTDTGAGGEVRGNYCTLNPLDTTGLTFANGNLDVSINTTSWRSSKGTISMASGKWYFECTPLATFNHAQIGVSKTSAALPAVSGGGYLGINADSWCYQSGGSLLNNGGEITSGISSAASGDIMMVAVDVDAGKLWFGKNGTWFNSGAPATGSNAAYTNLSGAMSPAAAVYNNASGLATNFGQRPFAYTAPSGFKALCTQNLPTPDIGATSATQAGKYFNTVLYTGNGATTGNTQVISTVGFQPDLVWFKSRSNAYSHVLIDAVRGGDKILYSDQTSAQINSGGGITAFSSTGFTVATDTTNGNSLNTSGSNNVAWNWKANGAGSTNNAGSIQSTVSASTLSGFSIVTYTGNGTSGATVGHGLGVTPSMVMLHRRDAVSNWQVKHVSLNANQNLELNSTAAVDTAPGSGYISAISSTTLTLLNGGSAITNVNANTGTYLAYCFAPVAGYSAFGSYTGNGSTDGVFVYTGMRPKFILIKASSTTSYWVIFDVARNTYNVMTSQLWPNVSDAENNTYGVLDAVSNGFKLRNTAAGWNDNGATYIYAAFAESPFKYSLAR